MGNYADIKAPMAKIVMTRVLEDDDYVQAPDERDEGFWPSLDPKSPGWIGDNPATPLEEQQRNAEKRMDDYNNGVWNYVGVRAKAEITLPIGGNSVITYTLKSAGLWGIESDSSEEYLNEVFDEQATELLRHIRAIASIATVIIEKE